MEITIRNLDRDTEYCWQFTVTNRYSGGLGTQTSVLSDTMCVTTVTLGTAPSKMRTPTNYVSSGGSSGGAIWIEFTLPDDCGGLDVTGFKVLAEENELKGLPFQVAEISPNLKGIQDSTGSCKLGSSNDSPVQNYKFTTIPTSSGRNASIKANTLYTVYVDVSNTQGDSYERSDGLEILTAGKTGPAPPVLDCVVNRRHGESSPSKCLLPLTKKTGGTMQLSWSPPEDTGGGIIIGTKHGRRRRWKENKVVDHN